jgi:hypothetical protein
MTEKPTPPALKFSDEELALTLISPTFAVFVSKGYVSYGLRVSAPVPTVSFVSFPAPPREQESIADARSASAAAESIFLFVILFSNGLI